MKRIELYTVGHAEWTVLAEVWRFFFGESRHEEETGMLVATMPSLENTVETVTIESRIDSSYVRTSKMDTAMLDKAMVPLIKEPYEANSKRRVLKRQLYLALSVVTGISFPWGALTGVRPTQVAKLEKRRTGSDRGAKAALLADWYVSQDKANLAVEVNRAEQAILAKLAEDGLVLYVGVPFCPSRCVYCSFASCEAGQYPHLLQAYTDAVIEEVEACFQEGVAAYGRPLALYIGGGTPTTLSDDDFDSLLGAIVPITGTHLEITVEAGRPETITAEKFGILHAYGISRICLNPQTMHESTLAKLNRHHHTDDIYRVFDKARRYGMDDINMDLIAGLEGEKPEDFLYSVEALIDLNPEKITLHALAKKAGSHLHQQKGKGGIYVPLPAWIHAFQEAQNKLQRAGYEPYYLYRQKYTHAGLENVGFAKPGHETVYNVAMMSDQVNVLGFGAGSTSKFIVDRKAKRLYNPKAVQLYIDRARAGGLAKRQAWMQLGRCHE